RSRLIRWSSASSPQLQTSLMMSAQPLNDASTAKRSRVIVIDDDPLFRNLIVSMLRKDFFVSVASEGSEGYYKAIEHPPDVAVIDVQMPGWDGLKTLKAFRAHQLLSPTMVMMLTGDASRETVVAAIQGGAHDYVIKTKFSREEFLSKLQRLLSNREVRTAAAAVELTRDAETATPTETCAEPHGRRLRAVPALAAVSDELDLEFSDPKLQTVLDSWE
ncbi:MAG TPA: response regulator, partial [Planctomycetaceae bacterium]|nr:response regulator [Planctomycetaceae bacterium]